jgi:hypothetical protein
LIGTVDDLRKKQQMTTTTTKSLDSESVSEVIPSSEAVLLLKGS